MTPKLGTLCQIGHTIHCILAYCSYLYGSYLYGSYYFIDYLGLQSVAAPRGGGIPLPQENPPYPKKIPPTPRKSPLTFFQISLFLCLYVFLLTKLWHDQGKWVTCRKCQFLFSYTTFSKLQNASFWCKPHHNWVSGYRIMKDLTMLNTIWNKGNGTLFLPISQKQHPRHPTHSSWSCHNLAFFVLFQPK